MPVGQVIALEPFLSKLFSCTEERFVRIIQKCGDTKLQLLVEVVVNARMLADKLGVSSRENKVVKKCKKLIKYFRDKDELVREDVKTHFIQHRKQFQQLGLQVVERVISEVCHGVVNQ